MNKPQSLCIGLMSGTSLDGVDGVLARVKPQGQLAVQSHAFTAFDAPFKAELMALNQSGPNELHRSALAGNQIARHYANVVHQLLSSSGLQPQDIAALAIRRPRSALPQAFKARDVPAGRDLPF